MADNESKLGSWKRYKSEGEEELFTFIGKLQVVEITANLMVKFIFVLAIFRLH